MCYIDATLDAYHTYLKAFLSEQLHLEANICAVGRSNILWAV
jgi:hypothetical protein